MATTVKTHSVCDRCGAVNVRDGADGHLPPVGWADIEFTRRDAGSGWTNATQIVKGMLCPDCTEAMRARFAEHAEPVAEVSA